MKPLSYFESGWEKEVLQTSLISITGASSSDSIKWRIKNIESFFLKSLTDSQRMLSVLSNSHWESIHLSHFFHLRSQSSDEQISMFKQPLLYWGTLTVTLILVRNKIFVEWYQWCDLLYSRERQQLSCIKILSASFLFPKCTNEKVK